MGEEFTYQGIKIDQRDIDFIIQLIRDNLNDSRRQLSYKLCRAWNWVQPNGQLRDMFCGWTAEVRKKNLHLIAYNTRYLILPWVEVKNLASHLLAVIAKRLSADWQGIYNH